MVNVFGRLATLTTAVVVGSSIFYSAAYIDSSPKQSETVGSYRDIQTRGPLGLAGQASASVCL